MDLRGDQLQRVTSILLNNYMVLSIEEKRRKHNESMRDWRKKNPERNRELIKAAEAKKPEKYKAINREKTKRWDKNNPEKRDVVNKNNHARNKGAEGFFTLGEWNDLKSRYGFKCPSCGKSEPEIKLVCDHIIPISKGGANIIANIQPLCRSCNAKKYTKIVRFDPITE